MLIEWLTQLEASAPAAALRASRDAYPLVNALHIMALGTVFGAIAAFDLRVLGVARGVPLRPLAVYLPRVAGVGLAVAILSGFALFSVKPLDYVDNRAFLLKLALVAFGVLHALALHASTAWKRLLRERDPMLQRPGLRLKLSAALSLATWIAAIVCGRYIAF